MTTLTTDSQKKLGQPIVLDKNAFDLMKVGRDSQIVLAFQASKESLPKKTIIPFQVYKANQIRRALLY